MLPSVRRSRSQFISHHTREGTRLIVANAAKITLYLLLLFSQSSKSSSSRWCERRKLRRCDVRQLIYDLCTGPLVRLLGSGCTHEIDPKLQSDQICFAPKRDETTVGSSINIRYYSHIFFQDFEKKTLKILVYVKDIQNRTYKERFRGTIITEDMSSYRFWT